MPAPEACRNCGARFDDAYCGACGQRRFVESDRRFGHLVTQFLGLVTDLDGRLWGSLRALLLRPGLLERDYMAGRRRRWLPPVTLFLLANLVYFMAPLRADFDLSFVNQVPGPMAVEAMGAQAPAGLSSFPGQLHSAATTPLLERVLARRDARERAAGGKGYGLPELRRDYDAIAGDPAGLPRGRRELGIDQGQVQYAGRVARDLPRQPEQLGETEPRRCLDQLAVEPVDPELVRGVLVRHLRRRGFQLREPPLCLLHHLRPLAFRRRAELGNALFVQLAFAAAHRAHALQQIFQRARGLGSRAARLLLGGGGQRQCT